MKPKIAQAVIMIVLLVLIIASVSCSTSPIKPTENAPSKVYKLAWEGKRSSAEYTQILTTLLQSSKLKDLQPTDLKSWCPKKDKADLEFYAQLISMMVIRESGADTNQKYTESFKDSAGQYVVSRGLLQISIESAKSYNKQIKEAQELHDPAKNLQTGILILERWIERDKVIAGGTKLGAGRYWSVMRASSGSQAKIKAYMNSLPECKK